MLRFVCKFRTGFGICDQKEPLFSTFSIWVLGHCKLCSRTTMMCLNQHDEKNAKEV